MVSQGLLLCHKFIGPFINFVSNSDLWLVKNCRHGEEMFLQSVDEWYREFLIDDILLSNDDKPEWEKNGQCEVPSRPFNYMFFTPLYGVRNTGWPQISTKKFTQIRRKNFFFLFRWCDGSRILASQKTISNFS
jgi:hypothetical protein